MGDVHLGDTQTSLVSAQEDLRGNQGAVRSDQRYDLVERATVEEHARVCVLDVDAHEQSLDVVVRGAGKPPERIVGTVDPAAGDDVRSVGSLEEDRK